MFVNKKIILFVLVIVSVVVVSGCVGLDSITDIIKGWSDFLSGAV